MTEDEAVVEINKHVREEHGSSINIDSMWIDANVDSFGSIMVFLELDDKYHCFDKDWLSSVKGEELTVREMVNRIISAG